MIESSVFLSITGLKVRQLAETLFEDLNFTIRHSEHWALVGDSNSGKSDLLRTLAGLNNVTGGEIRYHFYEEWVRHHSITDALSSPRQLIAMVSGRHHFRNLSHTTDFYYQQRFNAWESEDAPTVDDYLRERETGAPEHHYWTSDRLEEKLDINKLRDKRLIHLSNGETRRVMLAAALIRQPRLLLLDHPFAGLDAGMRPRLSAFLDEVAASGIQVVMATTPAEIPASITHVAVLQQRSIAQQILRTDFHPAMVPGQFAVPVEAPPLPPRPEGTTLTPGTEVIRMEKVSVKYGNLEVLKAVDWRVLAGERWNVSGPNGAGKSTLLSLVTGDHPQAYANAIWLFGKRRGSGESIWDIKKRIGYVSPELMQYFETANTCLEVVASGLFDTMGLFRPPSEPQWALARQWAQVFHLEKVLRKRFSYLSLSEKRLCLLARAMIKQPPLLILDEPCQGLDNMQRNQFRHLLDTLCAHHPITMVYITHHEEELPESITHRLML